jgi:hypothetical protein
MSKQAYDREALKIRFLTNMRRIGAITSFLHSDVEGVKPTAIFRSEGVRADMLRAIVVFLPATVEDFVRSHFSRKNKKFHFYSAADIRRALSKLRVEPALFADLFPPLTQMAKRRNQIVHRADLKEGQSEAVDAWLVPDDWQLIQWHLAVSVFYYRLRKATGPVGMVENRAAENVERALLKNVEFGQSLIALSKLPPEKRQEGIMRLVDILESIRETLKLEVEMFLGPDGQPLEGAT